MGVIAKHGEANDLHWLMLMMEERHRKLFSIACLSFCPNIPRTRLRNDPLDVISKRLHPLNAPQEGDRPTRHAAVEPNKTIERCRKEIIGECKFYYLFMMFKLIAKSWFSFWATFSCSIVAGGTANS